MGVGSRITGPGKQVGESDSTEHCQQVSVRDPRGRSQAPLSRLEDGTRGGDLCFLYHLEWRSDGSGSPGLSRVNVASF